MELIFSIKVFFYFCWLVDEEITSLNLYSKDPNLIFAVNEVINEIFENSVGTLNVITVDDRENLMDFKEKLLSRALAECDFAIRQEFTSNLTFCNFQKRQSVIFIMENYEDFHKFYQKLTPEIFKFNGIYLIILVNGEIPELEKIFQLLWKIQVLRIFVVFENVDGSVPIKTFMPFATGNCYDTSPVTIETYKDGQFSTNKTNLNHDKMENLNNCKVRVTVTNNTEPFVISRRLTNGTFELKGTDIKILNALSETLNFSVDYVYIGSQGYLLKNGTSEGPLRYLLDAEADLSITNWWLKLDRLKFLDATSPYLSDQIIFVVPPGRELTAFEKLIFPFTLNVWLIGLGCLLTGCLIIFLIKRRSKATQNFVFGSGVTSPYLNMFIGFIGGSQQILPQRNFARFLLMMFLLQTLVMRTLYQGSFFNLMRSHKRVKEVQSVDEMIEKDFEFYTYKGNADIFQGLSSK